MPNRFVSIGRSEEILVAYLDEHDKERKKTFAGLTARVVQHEIDHLNGRLIIDYLPWYKKIISKKGN